MLEIIEGGLYSDAYGTLKDKIKELTLRGERAYLIVPEQQAVIAEKDIYPTLPTDAPLFFEVTNFTRLANTVYRSLGGIAGEYADRGKKALIMWKTLSELSPVLNIMSSKEVNTGLVEKALLAVSEMRSASLTADGLWTLSENEEILKNSRLSSKLSDIAKIMALFEKNLRDKNLNGADECEGLAKKLCDNPGFFKNTHFFFSGFTSFTEPQYKVIHELIRSAGVTVHLPISRAVYEHFEFSEIKATKERLIRLADLSGAKKILTRSEAHLSSLPPLLAEVSSQIFRNFTSPATDNFEKYRDTLRIFEANDPYKECDFVAADIKRRVMGGASYRDFAIVARDLQKYSGIIDSSLSAANIPYFNARSKNIYSYEAVKMIFAASSAVESGFSREAVISYMKCGFTGVSAEACDEFELYTETWQLSGESFTDGEIWNMNPDGYTERRSGDTDALLARINGTKKTVMEPLVLLKKNLNKSKTVREYAGALADFLISVSLDKKIAERCDTLSALGENSAADENAMLWQIIISSLDTVVDVLGDTPTDSRGFFSQLGVILASADIGKIPANYDEVTLGSADMLRLSEKRHVYVIGVNLGEFPRSSAPASYFTERDKETLASLGAMERPERNIPYARELFFFLRAFSSAKESVTLTYSTRTESLTPSSASEIIGRIKEISSGAISPVRIDELQLDDILYFPAASLEYIGRAPVREALIASGSAREVSVAMGDISNNAVSITEEVAKSIYPGDIPLTQTRLESYVNCPFAYYLKYNIKLKEGERAEFDARNIGSFVHSILESFFGELGDSGESAGDVSQERKRDIVERAAKKYLSSVIDKSAPASKRTGVLIDRLCQSSMPIIDGLCDELRDADFVPRFFELKIDGENELLPRPATFDIGEGKKAYVYGSIDRVDTYTRESDPDVYVRVIDYKTGKKDFSPSDIDEGKNLQMFLYLKAITDTDSIEFKRELGVGEGGKIIPAGVIYIKTDMSDVTVPHDNAESERAEIAKKQQRKGMLLKSSESIAAMNPDYIPIKLKNDGTVYSNYEKFLYTPSGWDDINDKIGDKIKEIATDMKRGNISLTEKKKDSPCDYCSFKAVCRKK